MTDISTSLSKPALRSLYKTVRSHIGQEYREKAARAAARVFIKEMPLTSPLVIAGYAPLPTEFNVIPLLEELHTLGHLCALPVMQEPGQPLLFKAWKPDGTLIANSRGIGEPDASSPLITPDIIITPLLACDKTGTRLGYGKGYYDRTIEALKAAGNDILAVGVCYHVQVAEAPLPCDSYDQKLDRIITEKGVI